jgi:hypothetical protein
MMVPLAIRDGILLGYLRHKIFPRTLRGRLAFKSRKASLRLTVVREHYAETKAGNVP